ncbi:hypothetical protein SAMN05443665_100157 [Actinomadura meyerae]|uniref:Uncharacterized protein n=1 Tax=Actinomadura meyerae TaxID=240840 RepID=A0A239BTX5_9ACTN|nr:hypothetical protein [Actinomadura meyerae]SNS11495.1 hypothetical protein SAMN05443665_100157 [Actinomadura meyerae]
MTAPAPEQAATTAPAPAPALVPLPEGRYACADCGVMAPEGAPFSSKVPVFKGQWYSGPGTRVPTHAGDVLLARCPSCARRASLAVRLLSARPDVLARRGTVAHEHLVAALCGLTVAGGSPTDHSDPERLIQEFAAGGVAARWSSLAADHPGECTSAPWAHVPDEVRADLRGVAARLLAVRKAAGEPPVDLAPPAGGGCAMCGLASVRLSAAQVVSQGGREQARAKVWTPRTVEGRDGALCTPCNDAAERAGAVGWSAFERAYLEHLRRAGVDDIERARVRRRLEDRELTVRPWCTSGAAVSSVPWAHVRA